jgi:DNA repair protein RecO (recombination protein O)
MPLAAIVVGGVDQGEANRIIRFLTADRGRISAMARGARSSKKRFRGLLDPGTRVRIELRRGRGSLVSVTEMDLVGSPNRVRTELERIALLAWGCEVCSALAPEDHAAPKLFTLLAVWLELLEGEVRPGVASRVALEAKALTFAGLAPVLDRCAHCGEPLDAETLFDLEMGGAVHRHCGTGRAIGPAYAELERLRWMPLANTLDQPVPQTPWMLADFIEHQLGKGLKSRAMLEML